MSIHEICITDSPHNSFVVLWVTEPYLPTGRVNVRSVRHADKCSLGSLYELKLQSNEADYKVIYESDGVLVQIGTL